MTVATSPHKDKDNALREDASDTITTESGNKWRSLKSLFRREKKVAIIIDGPNLLRKVGNKHIKVGDIDQVAENLGSISSKYIILNHHASNKLIEAMLNSGYSPIVERGDIYIRLTMKGIETLNRSKIDILLIGSRDARIVPLLMTAREKGVETAIVGFDPGFSVALKNVADYAFELR
ncbi:MAG: hypothetical protein HeimC2_17440 [Candidatus Heimdallarchaeota archaeon LC_2]|nr:MAG: hypothetical protein HeimC2_17440 [Candidatus Heimdallarchaeota archaeon LC_2]